MVRFSPDIFTRHSRWPSVLQVAALLAHGADPRLRDSEGDSPLALACRNGHNAAANLLAGSEPLAAAGSAPAPGTPHPNSAHPTAALRVATYS